MELPEFFTAQQAIEVANEANSSREFIELAVNGLRKVMSDWIKPVAMEGGGNVWVEIDRAHVPYYHVRWKIKAALEMNGFKVVESWQNGVMWKVSWSNE